MMTDKTVRGRFVWHELMTPDTSAAHSFYSKTLGWKIQPSDQVADYSMFVAPSGPLGGSVPLPAGAPHWLAYVGTPDIDATVAQARDLGAKVVKDVDEIPGMDGSKYAVLNDPQGAQFAVYTSTADPGRDKPAKRGEFSWHELMTTDAKAALDFYCELFGWEKRQAHDMGPMGFYYLFGRNGQEIGGMFDKPANVPGGPAWLGYVRVKDVNQIVKKVKSAGGTLANGPMEVPGGDWIAQFIDPHGAAFAVHTVKADVTAAEATSVEDESLAVNEDTVAEESEESEESEAPAAKPSKPRKTAAAKQPSTKAKAVAKKKSAPASKQRVAAKAKKPAGKSAKANATKKAVGKSAKASKGAKAVKGAKAKVTKAKTATSKVAKTKAAKTKAPNTKGAKGAKKPARKK
jgi:predicted enzyme related to lactoylglutathione lyase